MVATTTKAELFTIRCGINQAVQISKVSYIIFMVEKNFDSKIHFYQLQLIVIAQYLRVFSNKHAQNSIDFCDCPSNTKWSHYISVDKETKKFNLTPILSCKVLWNFNKKEECNNIIRTWQKTFQKSNIKGNYFLELLDDEYCMIKHSYTKGSP